MATFGFLASTLPACLAALAVLGWWRSAARSRTLAARTRAAEAAAASELQARTDLQQTMRELEEAASRDRLTGAWNRRHFEEVAAAEMSLARRRRLPLALIIVDLDHFKRINDTFGHPAGDAVLAGTVTALRPVLRASDVLVRWGGEEFLVLAPATNLEGALRLGERLRAALAATAFPGAEPITLSAGVAEYLHDEDVGAWVARADRALFRAKAGGRDQVAASPGTTAQAEPNLLELVWEEAYASGHRLIDAQHILLFELSNALFAALLEGRSQAEVEGRLDALIHHTDKHFRDEESLLQRADYPDLPEHHRIHAGLLATAHDLQQDLREGQVDFGRLVVFLVNDVVKGHLITEDRHYFAHLNEKLGPASQA